MERFGTNQSGSEQLLNVLISCLSSRVFTGWRVDGFDFKENCVCRSINVYWKNKENEREDEWKDFTEKLPEKNECRRKLKMKKTCQKNINMKSRPSELPIKIIKWSVHKNNPIASYAFKKGLLWKIQTFDENLASDMGDNSRRRRLEVALRYAQYTKNKSKYWWKHMAYLMS